MKYRFLFIIALFFDPQDPNPAFIFFIIQWHEGMNDKSFVLLDKIKYLHSWKLIAKRITMF